MKRREFVKTIPLTALVPAGLAIQTGNALAESGTAGKAPAGKASTAAGGGAGSGAVPEFAEHMLTTDMNGLGPDGKPTGKAATFTGASKAGATADSAGSKMELTADELFKRSGDDTDRAAHIAGAGHRWRYAMRGGESRRHRRYLASFERAVDHQPNLQGRSAQAVVGPVTRRPC